jgi:hypothetical protein
MQPRRREEREGRAKKNARGRNDEQNPSSSRPFFALFAPSWLSSARASARQSAFARASALRQNFRAARKKTLTRIFATHTLIDERRY